ncbi:hypothetical protein AAF712_012013 [Marasmius tenuissimus]|uniref:Thiaminase-2/PQQC domain-containing protein n=1 Tax=Marasmius tenuissimus TaxID=585030 RepID=A0ABR2ZIK2_9AGAR
MINDCEIGSIRSSLVARWFPELHRTLEQWTSIGHDNDILHFAGHFATYHDMQVSTLMHRSAEMHISLGWEMLYAATIGRRGPGHPVFQSFLKGFVMPCEQGYKFTQLTRTYLGGSDAFVSSVYLNFIESYQDLRIEYVSKLSLESEQCVTLALEAIDVDSFKQLYQQFLEGKGMPNVELMEAERGRFQPVVCLTDINLETFRMRMFCWATTGAPFAHIDGSATKIILVEDYDPEYGAAIQSTQLERALEAGVCKFRTCLREMRIPVSFLLRLLEAEYSDDDTALDAIVWIHHWFSVSLLDNIGDATIA